MSLFISLLHPQDLRDYIDTGLYVLTCLVSGLTLVQLCNYRKYGGETRKRKLPPLVYVTCFLILMSAVFHSLNLERHDNIEKYNQALQYEDNEEWDKAYNAFESLVNDGSFRDSEKHMEWVYPRYQYMYGKSYMALGSYYEAYEYFHNAGDYMNAKFFADYCYFVYLKNEHPEWLIENYQ